MPTSTNDLPPARARASVVDRRPRALVGPSVPRAGFFVDSPRGFPRRFPRRVPLVGGLGRLEGGTLFARTDGGCDSRVRSVGSIGRVASASTGAAKKTAGIPRVDRSVASAGNRRWFGLLPAVGADVDAVEDERRRAASNDGRVERVGVVARGGVRRRRGVGVER